MATPMLSFGVPGLIFQCPNPQAPMGYNNGHEIAKQATTHGGKSIVASPTTHKSFTWSWSDWDSNLRSIIDAHGILGSTAFWIQDPTADQNNLLPSRWSAAWQLGYTAGSWCRPVITANNYNPQNNTVTFTQVAQATANTKLFGVVRNRTLRAAGTAMYLAAPGGSRTLLGVPSLSTTFQTPLPAPVITLGTTSSSGGSFASGTYYWKLTAYNLVGATIASNEVTATVGFNGAQTINWTAVNGATGYNLFRGTAAGAENVKVAGITSGGIVTYTDTGAAGTAATLPSSNTTGDGSFAAGTYYWKVTSLSALGETAGSNEITATMAVNGSITLSWPAVPGATGYNVYRGTAAGAENQKIAANTTATTFKDTGATGTTASPPATDTGTGGGIIVRAFNSTTGGWTQVGVYNPATLATPTQVIAPTDTTTTFVELDLYVPAGTTLTLQQLSLGTLAWSGAFPNGNGVGACQFDGELQGTWKAKVGAAGWIGLAVNISEVERGDGVVRFG